MKKLLTFVLLTCMLTLAVGNVMAQAPQTAVGMGDLQPLGIQPNYMQGGAIQFALGATSAVVNGYVQQNASISYTIYAMQGQNFILLLSSDSGMASLSVSDVYGNSYAQAYEGRTYFNMVLPRTATYNVNVNAVGAASNYSLQVFIPAKVQIPLGQRSVSYNGTVGPYGVVSYTASAAAGQIAKIDCYSGSQPRAWLRISGMTTGQVYMDYTSYSPSWYVRLPETQDYLVEVVTLDQGTDYRITFEFD